MRMPRSKVMIIATGGQGEPRAALARIAGETHSIKLDKGDLVVFSSKQIPGNELAIGKLQNALPAKHVDMTTDRQELVLVSGHPVRPDFLALSGSISPQVLLPVHGEMRLMPVPDGECVVLGNGVQEG